MPTEQAEASAVLQEVHILASLEHPFIVRYYDSFVELRKLFLVMEYASNGSLHTVLQQHQRMQSPIEEVVIWQYTLQLLIGLHTIHSRRVLHRDIKVCTARAPERRPSPPRSAHQDQELCHMHVTCTSHAWSADTCHVSSPPSALV